jgi:protein ImuB
LQFAGAAQPATQGGGARRLKKSEQQIPRGLKSARNDKNQGFSARLKPRPFKARLKKGVFQQPFRACELQITNCKVSIELAMPFAAIYVPDFPVEAMVRAEPELREQAVAVVEGTPPLVHVVAVNERAAQAGVEPGMTRLQAESMVDGPLDYARGRLWSVADRDSKSTREGACATRKCGTVRERSREREAAAHAALLDCACGFSPRVEDTAADMVVLDLAGLERIFGPPAKMARDVARRCSEMGLESNVAVASNADTAALAARGLAGVTVIAEGKEAERLGELSVEVLIALPVADDRVIGNRAQISASSKASTRGGALRQAQGRLCATSALEILETLERWGVRNLRALAALPEVALAERLGQEGLQLQKLARGQTRRPLVVAELPLVFEEAAELEYPVDGLEPLAFLLNRMLEQLCARLAGRAQATDQLTVRLDLEVERDCGIAKLRNCGIENNVEGNSAVRQFGNSAMHERTLRLPVPMLDARVFLKLMQLDLQAHPPQAPVTKVWLRAEPAEPRRAQNGLFVPEAPEAEKLSVTLARIERVVRKSTADGRRSTAGDQSQVTDGQQVRVGSPKILDTHCPDGFRMHKFVAPSAVDRGPSTATEEMRSRSRPLIALRVFRPALAAVVTVREGKPAQVASGERPTMRGEVVWCAGPWRSSGEWWTEQAWRREEWDVAVRNEEGVALYRVYRDEIGGKWWVEGTYD